MSDDYQRIELITGTARRRYWSTEQKLRIIEQSFEPGETVSSVARRHGVAANLLYRWRRLMSEGGATAVGSDESVVGSSEVRKLEERVRRSAFQMAISPVSSTPPIQSLLTSTCRRAAPRA
jgi:transposase